VPNPALQRAGKQRPRLTAQVVTFWRIAARRAVADSDLPGGRVTSVELAFEMVGARQ